MPSSYHQVFEKNRAWVAARKAEDPDFFVKLSADPTPEFLFIGCSDARVPANQIMGLEPGEVFVHRNIGNVVSNTDLNVQSVIQYAVDVLHVRYVIVCGHYGCGGVKAALTAADMGLMNPWLREIRDVYRTNRFELEAIADETLRYQYLVELNVREQCLSTIKTAAVQTHYAKHGFPTVHGWVYDLHNGFLQDLQVPFLEMLEEVRWNYKIE